jgi:hypothetical protein
MSQTSDPFPCPQSKISKMNETHSVQQTVNHRVSSSVKVMTVLTPPRPDPTVRCTPVTLRQIHPPPGVSSPPFTPLRHLLRRFSYTPPHPDWKNLRTFFGVQYQYRITASSNEQFRDGHMPTFGPQWTLLDIN